MEALLAVDKGLDNNRLRGLLRQTQTKAVIPPKADRRDAIPCDFVMYRWRHLVENVFCDLKQFRGIATVTTRQMKASQPSSSSKQSISDSNEGQRALAGRKAFKTTRAPL